MSRRPISLLKRFQWSLEYALCSVTEVVAGLLPGAWVFCFGEVIAGIVWHVMPRRRKIVMRNLRIAFADKMEMAEIQHLAKNCFRRTGANLISAMHTAKLPSSKLKEVLEIENMELMEQALSKGKGVVLLLAHMGNWELLSRLIHFLPEEAKIGGLYRPLNNPIMDKRLHARREADGSIMFSKRNSLHQITKFLHEGGIVGVLADQRVGGNGRLVNFFGRLTRGSPLPSLLARRTKAEVLALSMTTECPGKWKGKFLPVDSPPSTSHCMKSLEEMMREHPEDVFWLQERWRVTLRKGRNITNLLEDGRSGKNKYHRALVWLPGNNDSWRMPAVWNHPDVVYEAVLESGRPIPSWLAECSRVHHVEREYSCCAEIFKIDQTEALPIDFVLTGAKSAALTQACNQQLIPLYVPQDNDNVAAGS